MCDRHATCSPDRIALRFAIGVAFLAACAGCTSVAQITTLADPPCRQALSYALAVLLEAQGETSQTAKPLAESAASALQYGGVGPRPFLVASPSGVDYFFFVERKDAACVLRLYGRQKGFVSYTNNLTYIATEQLAPCQCTE